MSGFRVFLADESDTVLGMVSFILESAGYSVRSANDGIEAVKAMIVEPPDLAILDSQLPRLSGTQVCRVLKAEARTQEAVILLLSSHSGAEAIHARRAGADRFLPKDFSPEEFLAAIGEALEGKTPREPVPPVPPPADAEILVRLNAMLESRLFEATLFNEIGRIGRDVDDMESTIRLMGKMLDEVVPHQAMSVVFSDSINLETVIAFRCPADEPLRDAAREWTDRLRDQAGIPFSPNRVRRVEHLFGGEATEPTEPTLLRPFAVSPIRSGEMTKGLVVLFAAGMAPVPSETGLTDSLLRQSFTVMENAWLYRQITRVSVTDGLTGLVNRRHFLEMQKKEHARAKRFRTPYTVLMTDVDHFKKVNDVYGHPIGDIVLREVSDIINESTRSGSSDLSGRYGGEEFIVLLPATGQADAMIVAERIRSSVERKVFASPSPAIRCSISIGSAAFDPENPQAEEDIRKRADDALYNAKREGRNCVRQG